MPPKTPLDVDMLSFDTIRGSLLDLIEKASSTYAIADLASGKYNVPRIVFDQNRELVGDL